MSSPDDETRQARPITETVDDDGGPAVLKRGDLVGRFVVLEILGLGGIGRVYRAYDPELDRQVAIKLLRPGRGLGFDRAQLLEEARLTAKLKHPNVVVVHDVGTSDGHVFIAMELVEGETLRQWREAAPRSIPDAVRVFLEAGEGLAAAHAKGIVHLDFKPSNVMIGRDGRARVVDFGLATLTRRVRAASDAGGSDSGSVRGTPAFMAPEQHRGEPADVRADVYAFGVSLWETVYGALPFFGKSIDQLLEAKEKMEPVAPQDVPLPPWIQRILLRALAPDPRDRPATMRELLDELAEDPVAKRRRRGQTAVAGLSLLGLGFAFSTMTRAPAAADASPPPLCTTSADAAGAVWNDEVRDVGRSAFLATRRPYAEQTWARVAGAIDPFVAAWAEGRDDACADTRVRKEQSDEIMDLRLACYDEALEELAAWLEVLREADAAVVDAAAGASEDLPALARCEDVVALRGREPEPAEGDARARWLEGRAQLRRIRALIAGGKPREAAEVVEPALAIARDVNYAPLVGRLLLEKFRARGTERAEARRVGLLKAASLARRAGASELELDAWTELIWSAGVFERDQPLGSSAVEYANALADASRASPKQRRKMDEASAAFFATSGDLDRAHGLQLDLVRRLEESPGSRVEMVGALNNLGNIQSMRTEFEKAAETYARVVSLARSELGNAHPVTLRARNNVAINRLERGEVAETLPELESLVADKRAIYGEQHQSVAVALAMLGNGQYRAGQLDAARDNELAALAMFTALQGPRSGNLVNAQVYLAEIEHRAGNLEASEAAVAVAMDVGSETLGVENPGMSSTFVMRGILRLERGDTRGAIEDFERALALDVKVGGEEVSAPELRYFLARALLARDDPGDAAAARAQLERSVAQFEADPGADAEDRKAALALRDELAP